MNPGTIMDISDARTKFNRMDEWLAEHNTPIVYVRRHKKNVFALVDIEYLEAVLETIEVLQDPETRVMLAASLEDIIHGRVSDHEDVKKRLL